MSVICLPVDPVREFEAPYCDADFFEGLRLFQGKSNVLILRSDILACELPDIDKLDAYLTRLNIEPVLANILSVGYLSVFRLTDRLIDRLSAISESHEPPEYCDDLFLLDDREVIIDASGFCHEPFHVSGEVSGDVVAAFSVAVGREYRLVNGVFGDKNCASSNG